MARKRLSVLLIMVLLGVGAACGDDDAPSTNTVGGSSPTEETNGNLTETATTPVAAGEDSIVQGNQPMQTAEP